MTGDGVFEEFGTDLVKLFPVMNSTNSLHFFSPLDMFLSSEECIGRDVVGIAKGDGEGDDVDAGAR